MITVKYKSQNHQLPPVFISFLQWILINLQLLCVTITKYLGKLVAQSLVVLRRMCTILAQHASISSFVSFIQLSLLANGFNPFEGLFSKPTPTHLLTDDELETCLDLDSKWSSADNPTHLFDQVPYCNDTPRPNISINDSEVDTHESTDTHSNDCSSNITSSTTVDPAPLSTKTLNSPSDPIDKPNTTLPQPKSVSKKKKEHTKSNPSVSPSDKTRPINDKNAPSNSNRSPPIEFKSPKSPNSKPVRSEPSPSSGKESSLPNKRDLSLVSGTSTPDTTLTPPTGPKGYKFHDPEAFVKVTKKQRQSKSNHKKKPSEVPPVLPPTSPKKIKVKEQEAIANDKGFKTVGKKSKRKKNSSLSKTLDTPLVVTPAPSDLKTPVAASGSATVPCVSASQETFLDSETGVLSEIMDAALLDLNQLSGREPKDVLPYSEYLPPYASPVSVTWPIDSRFFGHNKTISQGSGMESLHDSWKMKPPQTNFSDNQLHLQNQPLPFYFPNNSLSPVISSLPEGNAAYGNGAMFSPVSLSSVSSSLVSPPLSPLISDAKSFAAAKRQIRVTNSTLTWSVPEHMSHM